LLTILNLIESNKVLLELAKLYDDQGFGKMAVYEVLRSIKELNTIDAYSAKILCREIR
jgi:hypothetical protein